MTPANLRRIRELFDGALALAPDRRRQWLESLKDEPADLIAEVTSLLESFTDAGEFLQEPPDAAPPLLEPAGTRIGNFVIQSHIGSGGFGDIYLAEQTEPVRRTVAMKILKPGMDSREILSRFRAERQTLAMLDHPNIARIIDAGATPAGRPYFVMELVNGPRITAFCRERALSVRQRLELFLCVCDAVGHAHQRGIIHRDLKPANVLVAEVDGAARPKVIDFGIAKLVHPQDAPHVTVQTAMHRSYGTPAYMSPEQSSGGDVDTRSDIYSLGVMLHEIVHGTLPVRGTAGRGEIDWIIARCLREERDERYPTVNALAEDLRAHLAGRAIQAAPPSTWYHVRKFVARRRGAVAGTAAIGVALALGIGLYIRGINLERQRTRDALRTAQAVSAFQRQMFREANPMSASGEKVTVLEAMQVAIRQLDEGALRDQPLAEAAVRGQIGQTLLSLGDYELARANLERAAALFADSDAAPADLYCDALRGLGLVCKLQGDLATAEQLYRRALDTGRRLAPDDPGGIAATLNNLASLMQDTDRPAEAEQLYREALRLRREEVPPSNADIAMTMNNLASLLLERGNSADAVGLLRESLQIRRQVYPGDHPFVAQSMANLAVALQAVGQTDEIEPLLRDALAMRRRTLPTDHPDLAVSLNSLGRWLVRNRRFADAEPLLAEAVNLRTRRLGPTAGATTRTAATLAEVYDRLGRTTDAADVRLRHGLPKASATTQPQ